MSIQILGLRDYQSKDGKWKKKESFFTEGWRAETVGQLFADINRHLEAIPLHERFNLYYTVASCLEEPGRKLLLQTVIPFDVDGINPDQSEQVAKIVVEALGADWDKTGVVFSGNGVQMLIDQTVLHIDSVDMFEEWRAHYKACCAKINLALLQSNLEGSADVSVWTPAR